MSTLLTFPPARRVCAPLLGLVFVLFLGPGQAIASAVADEPHVAVALEPFQPLVGEDFMISIELEGTHLLRLDAIEIEAVESWRSMIVHLEEMSCASCDPHIRRLDFPVQGSATSLIEGEWELQVMLTPVAGGEEELVLRTWFAIGDLFSDHWLDPVLTLDPAVPTDDDLVELSIAWSGNVCGPHDPVLDRVEYAGDRIEVFLRYEASWSGHVRTGDPPPDKCSPALPLSGTVPVALGRLDPGDYELVLTIQASREHAIPFRAERVLFTVQEGTGGDGGNGDGDGGDDGEGDGCDDGEPTAEPEPIARLFDGRFEVEVVWTDHLGATGVAETVPDASDIAAIFTFFDPANWELLVKVLDGCTLNGHYWVFSAGASDVRYDIQVTDTVTGDVWTGTNPAGSAVAITDVEALATCD